MNKFTVAYLRVLVRVRYEQEVKKNPNVTKKECLSLVLQELKAGAK